MIESIRKSILPEIIEFDIFKEFNIPSHLVKYKNKSPNCEYAKYSFFDYFSSGQELLEWIISQTYIHSVNLDLDPSKYNEIIKIKHDQLKISDKDMSKIVNQIKSYGVQIYLKKRGKKRGRGDLIFFEKLDDNLIYPTLFKIPNGQFEKYNWKGNIPTSEIVKAVYSPI